MIFSGPFMPIGESGASGPLKQLYFFHGPMSNFSPYPGGGGAQGAASPPQAQSCPQI